MASMSAVASAVQGLPRIGPQRQLKTAIESYWAGKADEPELQRTAAELREQQLKTLKSMGLGLIPSNTFSMYDHVLDMAVAVGAVPDRFRRLPFASELQRYFAMARGCQEATAMEMTKWFDTNYHYIVPELSQSMEFRAAGDFKALVEYQEARALGIETVPVLLGPVSFLLLSKGLPDAQQRLDLLPKLLPAYRQLLASLAGAGAKLIQLDEPAFVLDRTDADRSALRCAYKQLGEAAAPHQAELLVATYFGALEENFDAFRELEGVAALSLDFCHDYTEGNLAMVLERGLGKTRLHAGVVDGRGIWANDLERTLRLLQQLRKAVPAGLVVTTSCSLLHCPYDLEQETALDTELKSWMAFGKQKVAEVVALAQALNGEKDDSLWQANQATMASRRSSTRTTDRAVRARLADVSAADAWRKEPFARRHVVQAAALKLPLFPTTTIGSFPQTPELRQARAEMRKGQLDEARYREVIKAEIRRVVKAQEELGLDVLVHGEPERNDMVEYFGEQLKGMCFTKLGWVQSYGTRCVKPPIIYGDVSRPAPMTVEWIAYAQQQTSKPMKGMLTGPVTILNWSFVRDDQPRADTSRQLALAILDEVMDLEAARIRVIQIDEAALRERLPLRRRNWQAYLDWAVGSFRLCCCKVATATQIHTHMCYSSFNDIIQAIEDMDADVVTIENARSDEKLLRAFANEGFKYGKGIGPGVYDIHSPRVPSEAELCARMEAILKVLEPRLLWVNPDCGLKTRKYQEVLPALANMVACAQRLRERWLASRVQVSFEGPFNGPALEQHSFTAAPGQTLEAALRGVVNNAEGRRRLSYGGLFDADPLGFTLSAVAIDGRKLVRDETHCWCLYLRSAGSDHRLPHSASSLHLLGGMEVVWKYEEVQVAAGR